MWCPKCAGKLKVNGTVTGETVNRQRVCLDCGATYQTVEIITYDDRWKNYARRAFETNPKIENYKQEILRGLD